MKREREGDEPDLDDMETASDEHYFVLRVRFKCLSYINLTINY